MTGKVWLACAVSMMLALPALLSRATDVTVSTGSADEFATNLDSIVADGGGTILVTTPVVIDGTNGPEVFDGVSNVVVNGGSANAIFVVTNGGDLTLANMVLENGVSTNAGGAVFVFSDGTATFTNCFFSNNIASGAGGYSPGDTNNAITNGPPGWRRGGPGQPAAGGAIFNLGNVSIFNCTFATNSAIAGNGGDGAGGGDGVTRGGVGGNGGNGGVALGGGIYTGGPLTVVNSTFLANFAQGGTGGTAGAGGSGLIPGVSGAGGMGGSAGGAGLYCTNTNAVVLILSSTFAGNIAEGGTSQTGGTGSAGLGQSGARGGNSFGGGIENDNGSLSILTNCTFFKDIANGGAGGNGGDGGGRGGNGGNGGAATGGEFYNLGTVTVVNCTFSKGSAVGGTNGVAGSGIAAARNGSRGASRGGNVANAANKKRGSFTLVNSIIATNLSGGGGSGTFIDGGFNISADRSIAFKSPKKGGTSLSRTNPLVGDLADNGGPTETVAITSTNSPAFHFIQTNNFPPTDQRGPPHNRNVPACAGAFELNPNELGMVTQPQSTNVPVGSNALFSVTVSGPNPAYQWYSDPSNVVADTSDLLPGETSSNLLLTDVQLTNDGEQFLVVITNGFSALTSHVATLKVFTNANSQPVITNVTVSPTNMVFVGTNVTINVEVGGTQPLTFLWFFQNNGITTNLTDGGNISGTTNSILSITNAQASDSGTYIVLVTNNFGAATNFVTLSVQTNNSGGGINPGAMLRLKPSKRGGRVPSLLPASPRLGISEARLENQAAPLRVVQNKGSFNQAPPPDHAAVDAARLWTIWRGARLPCRTSPGRPRSFRAIA